MKGLVRNETYVSIKQMVMINVFLSFKRICIRQQRHEPTGVECDYMKNQM